MRLRSLLENPFFVREYRQSLHRRKGLGQRQLLVMGTSALALVLLSSIHGRRAHGGASPAFASPWWLLLPHLLVCAGGGFHEIERMIAYEGKRNTLEQVRLLPLSAGEWLGGKCAYPLAVLLTTGIAPLPIFLVAAVRGLVDPSALARAVLLSLFILVALVPCGFLGADRPSQKGASATPREPTIAVAGSIRSVLPTLAGVAVFITGVLEIAPPWPSLSWFGVPIPFWLPVVACAAAPAVAGLAAGRALFLGHETAWRQFQWTGYAAEAVLYFTPVGIFWPLLPGWGRLIAVGFGPLIATLDYWQFHKIARPLRVRRDLPAWIALERPLAVAFGDNPTFAFEWRRMMQGRPLLLPVLGGVVASLSPLLVHRRGEGGGYGLPITLQFVIMHVALSGGVVRRRWEKDRESGFFDELSLTSLSSVEVVAGRVSALAAVHGGIIVGLILGVSCLFGWYLGWHGGVPLWVAVALLSLVAAPWPAARIAPAGGETDGFGSGSANVLLFTSLPAGVFIVILALTGVLTAVPFWLAGAVLVGAHVIYAWSAFRCRVREFEHLRTGGEETA